MRRVVWSDAAVADTGRITTYIAAFSPQASARLALRIKIAGDSLADQPDRGRMVSSRLRELTIIHPYVIRYRVEEERVLILRVRHGARRPL